MFTPNQVQELLDLVSDYTLSFVAKNIGIEVLSNEDIKILNKFGLNINNLKGKLTNVDEAFRFGILSSSLKEVDAKKLTYPQLKQQIKSAKWIPLTKFEKGVLQSVKTQSFKDIKGLGNRMGQDLTQILVDVDKEKRRKYEDIIRTEAIKIVENRETLQDMVSRLGHKTGDWSRNFGKISDYILHTAFDEGRVLEIERRRGQKALVYKDVYPGACKECIRLYLTRGIGSKPRIFTIAELSANGDNIGRKVKDWKAVIGSTHPHCRCTSREKPLNYEWDDETGGFTKLIKVKPKIEREKVRVKVGEKVKCV